jgi:hypothetical protein
VSVPEYISKAPNASVAVTAKSVAFPVIAATLKPDTPVIPLRSASNSAAVGYPAVPDDMEKVYF